MDNPDLQSRGRWTSASNAQADLLCAGRHLASRDLPEIKSDDADYGTAIHAALAKGSSDRLDATQEGIYESFLEIEKKLLVQYFGKEVEGLTPKPLCEQRFWCRWPDGLQHSAQLDRVHRKGSKVLIVECKSLVGEIPESPSNLQLRDQLCCYYANTVALQEGAVAVIQPLVTHSPTLCVYTKENIMRATEEMYARVNASNQKDAKRVAGDVQCKFCRAKASCLEYQQWATSLLPAPKSLVDVPVAEWTPDMRRTFCDQFDAAQRWLNQCWAAMESGAAMDPDFVPGYGMVEGSPRSTICNLQAVFDRASQSGILLADFLANATISKKALSELTRAYTKLKGRKLEEAVEKIIGSDVKLSEVKASLRKL